jgi:hypothetical protein
MNKIISIILISFYAAIVLFFFLLFIEESPFKKQNKIIRFREVFSVGWNFFTQDPRNNRVQIFYFKNNQWCELGKSSGYKEQYTRITDALQLDLFNYATQANDSLWRKYGTQTECMSDSINLNPYENFYEPHELPAKWMSRDFIVSNYGQYFLVVGSEKMPWAWLRDYSQMKMNCRCIITKI